ncbi:TPA: fimbrial protein [Salmonella enterica]
MKGRLLNLKTLLPLLMLLAVISNPAQADFDSSYCQITGAPLSIRNINLKGGMLPQNTVLQAIPLNISYKCTFSASNINYQPTLYLNNNIKPLVDALVSSRLGMKISISEGEGPTETFSWQNIKDSTRGLGARLGFGKKLENQPGEYSANASLTLSIFADGKGIDVTKPKNIIVPASNLSIIAYNQAGTSYPTRVDWLTIPAFSINIIPDNSGTIAVVPERISMGHFYTGDVSSQTKQASFTVTALQKAGVGSGGTPFTIPLGIEFQPGNQTILLDSDKTIKLINTNGHTSGLGLSIKEDSGGTVTFNKTAPMGDIMMGTDATGRVVKTYTATVAPISGKTINTGDFTAGISIIVTYQ